MTNHRDPTQTCEIERLEELFFGVLDQSPEHRDAYLDERCGSDAGLRAAVERMVRADRGSGGVIDDEAWRARRLAERLWRGSEDDPLSAPGVVIGGYRLVERIGVGGMGVVWRAQRADNAFERTVAIKLIKRGLDTDEVLRRFRLERQVLARLEHANIARLYDAGASDDGRPYLVMELIDGVPVDRYCVARAMGIRDILELVRKIGLAVQYAHTNLVVHRDLKPSNILITPSGEPKLLDFGIARLLTDEPGSDSSVSGTRQRLLTPRYASPEQIRGDSVSTASDVYSLGVVLYELLTGRLPYELKTDAPRELEQAILAREPTRPSTAAGRTATVHEGRTTAPLPARWRRALRGDLDTIVLTALRKQPERRYASAGALAADIERCLRHDPIAARPDTWSYRASRFARRNRPFVTMVALIFGVVFAGLIVTVSLFAHAERARALAVEERDAAEWNLYIACIAAADAALAQSYYPRAAMRHLSRAPERHRAWEWKFLKSQVDRSLVDMQPTSKGDRKLRVAWQPGGHLLACGEHESNGRLRVYDGRTGECVADPEPVHRGRIHDLAFSPDGTRLFSIATDGSVAAWDVRGTDVRPAARLRLGGPLHLVAVGPGGRSLTVSRADGSVHGLGIEGNAIVERWVYRTEDPDAPVISNEGSGVIAVGTPSALIVLDAGSGAELRSTSVGMRPEPIRLTNDGRLLGVVGRELVTWELQSLSLVGTSTVPVTLTYNTAEFEPGDERLAFRPDETHHFVLGNPKTGIVETGYRGHREYGILMGLAFSDDRERVAVASWERTLETWDISGTPSVRKLRWQRDGATEPDHFSSIDTPPDGSWIVARSAAGVSLWEPMTGVRLRTFVTPRNIPVECVRIQPNGERVAASGAAAVVAWETRTGSVLWSHAPGSPHPESTAASPDGRYLAVIEDQSDGGVVRLLDWRTGEVVRSFPRSEHGARCVEFSRDGRYLACGTGRAPQGESRVLVGRGYRRAEARTDGVWEARRDRRVVARRFGPCGRRISP